MNTTFTTRTEAIDSIIETIEAGDATRDEFDIDAIADDVIETIGEGVDYRFHVTDDDNAFWASVERHAL
jgi:hypothetical protein